MQTKTTSTISKTVCPPPPKIKLLSCGNLQRCCIYVDGYVMYWILPLTVSTNNHHYTQLIQRHIYRQNIKPYFMICIGTGHMDSTFYSFVNVKALIGNGQWYGGPEGTPHIANIFAKYLRNHKISLQIFAISQNIFEIIQLLKDLRPEALFRHLRGTTLCNNGVFSLIRLLQLRGPHRI